MIQKKIKYRQYFTFLILFVAYSIQAQIGTPSNPTYGNVQSTASSDYYSQLIGLSGTELRNALKNIVVNSTTKGQNYGDVWLMLREADENPANTNQVWQIYIESGIDKSEQNTGGSTGWNREHIFPQTRGGFADGTSTSSDGKDVYFSTSSSQITHAHGDAHHLRASFVGENSNRGNLDFGNVSGPRTKNSYFYEPPLSAKGDVARALFYMEIRYDALSLAAGDQDGQIIGDLTALLQWDKLDAPDDFEMRRNNVVYDWQNNRNPFIDNPNLVDYIWGDKQGLAWPGSTSSGIKLTSIDAFPVVQYGTVSESKTYLVEGTELDETLNIDAPEHFEISLNDIDFVKHLELNVTDGNLESTTIYVRFAPESAVGEEVNGIIEHYSGTNLANLTVSGTEGNPLLIPVDIYTQNFETNCAPDWTKYSVSSNKDWTCDVYGYGGGVAIAINNYQADANSEDWLISPQFDISSYSDIKLNYWMEWTYSGSTIELFYSTDYIGSGNPNDANWTKIEDVSFAENWAEYTTDLQNISESSYYLAFKHVSGSTSGFSSRINIDDISLKGINSIAQISSSTSNLNFEYTEAGNTSATISYTVSGENLEGNINITTELPFELSLDEALWQTSVTINQGEATDKQVFVRYRPIENYLGEFTGSISHSTTNVTNLIVDITVAENSNFPTDASSLSREETLDIVTWNLEYFGISEKSYPNWDAKLASVATTILNLDADIYALQEVIVDNVNGDFLAPLVEALNNQAGEGTYTGVFGPRFSLDFQTPSNTWPAQRVCYIYKTANFANVQSESMFSDLYPNSSVTYIEGYTGTASTFWASGRLPFLLQADVTIDGITVPLDFINIHTKCCSDSKDRKVADALFLKAELDENFDNENVIVLGDYNDYYIGSMSGGDSPYITWWENANEDYLRAAGASIDHISLSNELYFEHQSLTNNWSIGSTSYSDHNPILLRLKLDEENFNGQIVKIENISDKGYGSAPFMVNAESSEDLPLEYEIVSGPATLIGNVLTVNDLGTVVVKAYNSGNSTTLAASDQKEFDVVKGSQTITFNLQSEIELSEGNVELAASSSSGLTVSFRITSGTGTISGNQLYFTSTGNITVEAYQNGNDKYNAAVVSKTISVSDGSTSVNDISKSVFSIYPNPSDGIINISNYFNYSDAIVKIYTTTGLFIESYKLNESSTIDLNYLDSGVYVVKFESKEVLGSRLIIIE